MGETHPDQLASRISGPNIVGVEENGSGSA